MTSRRSPWSPSRPPRSTPRAGGRRPVPLLLPALCTLLLAIGLAGPAGEAGAQAAPPTTPPARPTEADQPVLKAGDQLRITVWRNAELSGDFTIGGDGTIQHPLYNDIVAAGTPVATLEQQVRTLLTRFESEPRFVMQPLVRVAVGGQVRTPSLYLFTPTMSVAEAVVMSGGVTDAGRLDRVRLIRDGQERRLDLTRPDMRDGMIRVRSGDQIIVYGGRSFFSDVLLPTTSLVAAITSIALLFTNR